MHILIYGECEMYGTGAWCYFQAFEDMGYDVYSYSPIKFLEKYQKSVFYKVIKKVNNGYFSDDLRKHQDGFIEVAKKLKPNIIVVLKGLLLNHVVIERLKKNAFIVLINHDDFFSKFKNSTSNVLFKSLGYYDHIFVTKKVNVKEIQKYNNNVSFFQFSYYPKIHNIPRYNSEDEKIWSADIVFIGNSYPKRIRQLRYLVNNLGSKYKIRIYGGNWNKISTIELKESIDNKYLYPDDLKKAIYYSKISLCFLCEENRDEYTQRTFEIPACGGFLMAENTSMHKLLFRNGTDAILFDDNNDEDLLLKVVELLEDSTKREQIRNNGIKAVQKYEYTYAARISEIVSLYLKKQV